jgi:hypothetical protein
VEDSGRLGGGAVSESPNLKRLGDFPAGGRRRGCAGGSIRAARARRRPEQAGAGSEACAGGGARRRGRSPPTIPDRRMGVAGRDRRQCVREPAEAWAAGD